MHSTVELLFTALRFLYWLLMVVTERKLLSEKVFMSFPDPPHWVRNCCYYFNADMRKDTEVQTLCIFLRSAKNLSSLLSFLFILNIWTISQQIFHKVYISTKLKDVFQNCIHCLFVYFSTNKESNINFNFELDECWVSLILCSNQPSKKVFFTYLITKRKLT